ncbi:hypothetical protein CLV65_1482 [Pseudoscardovia suis]|uniref:Uncharacterized protein n=2 Tax=Pseudoscardovia suis TaxID=987063 RepID=A0A261F103_9BIFI|nr:hypothetical protein PSSU_0373 [Pseudoscardovia suis]PJJ64930.1 hypothetical protein CLV65_1482 [Pseudoscardovia suis]
MLFRDVDYLTRLLSIVGGILSITVAMLTVSPNVRGRLARWLLSSLDPADLPQAAPMRHISERLDSVEQALNQLQRDTVKNTLMHLMREDDGDDHTQEVAYELAKLKALGGDCWVVDAAQRYLIDHTTGAHPRRGKEEQ